MAQAVKVSRRYVSATRAEQARQTRREIIAAAHRLLVEQGYKAATIGAVAQEAGVALQTIYTAVGNKRALLRAVIESAVAGDDAPRTVLERFRDEVHGEADPRERLRRGVSFVRKAVERAADAHRIMASAADADPEIQAALAEVERLRYRDAATFVRLIAAGDGFGPGMGARTAADLWFALTSFETYDLLTRDRRWSPVRYETWIARSLEPIIR
jgi:AcrR family transcriptional regulator